jgi:hypothetical protein
VAAGARDDGGGRGGESEAPKEGKGEVVEAKRGQEAGRDARSKEKEASKE